MTLLERSARRQKIGRSNVRNRPSQIASTNGGLFPSSGLSFKREGIGAMNRQPPSNGRTSTQNIRWGKDSITSGSLTLTAALSVELFGQFRSSRNRTIKERNHTLAVLSIPHPSISRQQFPPMADSMIPLILTDTSKKSFKE